MWVAKELGRNYWVWGSKSEQTQQDGQGNVQDMEWERLNGRSDHETG